MKAVSISFSARIDVPGHVVVRELDGEAVVLNLDSEEYYGLDEVGTSMWNALTRAESIDAACSELAVEYDVEPARLRDDVAKLVGDLRARGLVMLRDA